MRLPQAWLVAMLALAGTAHADPPARTIDLATVGDDALLRVLGTLHDGGLYGVPVAGGRDVDGDGHPDLAMAAIIASPLGRDVAGEVYLIFGDGTLTGTLDTALPSPRILPILGDGEREVTGAEIWIDDVTGDGLGDLLIGRENYTPDPSRPGAGALTIIAGSPALRALAESGTPLDLRSPPPGLAITTLVGVATTARLGIWMRTGDVTGDGIADVVVGSDQESSAGEAHHGAVYLVRGGPQLAVAQTVDLAGFGAPGFPLAGDVARVRPAPPAPHQHFGATCQIGDLDGDGRAEVLAASALTRAGAVLAAAGQPASSAHATGGTAHGTLTILWDETFADPWPDALDLVVGDPDVVATLIDGGAANSRFGEEIVAGRDWDGDGVADLFVGDLVGTGPGRPLQSGVGNVLFGVGGLRGAHFDMDAPPVGLATTTFWGAIAGEIAADTAIDGDFDGDGRADLMFTSPHAEPLGRVQAGALHVFFGRDGAWPARVDLADGALPPQGALRITKVLGAHGAAQLDMGDVLGYSAAAGDLDGDGRTDLIVNEMLGDGATPAAEDAGNLIALSGRLLAPEPGGLLPVGVAFGVLLGFARSYPMKNAFSLLPSRSRK